MDNSIPAVVQIPYEVYKEKFEDQTLYARKLENKIAELKIELGLAKMKLDRLYQIMNNKGLRYTYNRRYIITCMATTQEYINDQLKKIPSWIRAIFGIDYFV